MSDLAWISDMKYLLILILSISLTSCGDMIQGEVRGPFSGVLYTEDGAKIDQQTMDTLSRKASRLARGERLPNVILDPVK